MYKSRQMLCRRSRRSPCSWPSADVATTRPTASVSLCRSTTVMPADTYSARERKRRRQRWLLLVLVAVVADEEEGAVASTAAVEEVESTPTPLWTLSTRAVCRSVCTWTTAMWLAARERARGGEGGWELDEEDEAEMTSTCRGKCVECVGVRQFH